MKFNIIVAYNLNYGIGIKNQLLYKIKNDMKYFKEITTGNTNISTPNKKNVVIMGRKTYESIPKKFRPLPDRLNIVITRNENYPSEENMLISNSFENALEQIKLIDESANIFVIGGGEIYKTALQHSDCQKIFATKVYNQCEADVFFPKLNDNYFKLLQESPILVDKNIITSTDIQYQFLVYERI